MSNEMYCPCCLGKLRQYRCHLMCGYGNSVDYDHLEPLTKEEMLNQKITLATGNLKKAVCEVHSNRKLISDLQEKLKNEQ